MLTASSAEIVNKSPARLNSQRLTNAWAIIQLPKTLFFCTSSSLDLSPHSLSNQLGGHPLCTPDLCTSPFQQFLWCLVSPVAIQARDLIDHTLGVMGVSLRSDVAQEGAKSCICPKIDSYSTFGTDPFADSLDKGMETVALGSGLSLLVGVGDEVDASGEQHKPKWT